MLLLLVLPVLVAGFFACHFHPVHSYKLHRYRGQYLYLKSAELGLRCFGLAFVICLTLHYQVPGQIAFFGQSFDFSILSRLTNALSSMGIDGESESKKLALFVVLSATMFVSAFIIKIWGHFSLFLRYGTWKTKVFVIGQLLEDSPLDHLLFRLSLQKNKYAMIVMQDRKVYVGKVISLGEPSETNGMDQDISIIPLMSGYRGINTLRVYFKTFYDRVDSDIYTSLRQESIVSVTEFDFDAWNTWNAPRGRD